MKEKCFKGAAQTQTTVTTEEKVLIYHIILPTIHLLYPLLPELGAVGVSCRLTAGREKVTLKEHFNAQWMKRLQFSAVVCYKCRRTELK